MERQPISESIIKHYAKLYNIKLSRVDDSGKRTVKLISEVVRDIKIHEKLHKIKNGLFN
jgi:hypothetical protein